MFTALEFIKDQLITNANIIAEIPAANCYPVIAPVETTGDFLVFSVDRNSKFTKDSLGEYEAEIQVFSTNIMDAANKADIIELELTNHERIYGLSAGVKYTEDFTRAWINLILTFKI